jgi:cytochrome P450
VPAHVPPSVVHPFNHWNTPEYLADPLGFWDDMRHRHRVFWSPRLGGFWCLTRYADIFAAYQRADLFSSNPTVAIPARPVRLVPLTLDRPEHTAYRRLLNQSFAPTRVDELSVEIRARCVELTEAAASSVALDFMKALAEPLPSGIFCKLLGLPATEIDRFIAWNDTIIHVAGDPQSAERQREANATLNVYLNELVGFRKAHPEDDLVSWLLGSTLDGRPLTDQEVLDMTYLLFMAGLDTVTLALGWSWHFLATHPEHRRQLVEEPGLIPNAVEELLRAQAFVTPARTVTRDAVFAGVQMRAGDRIMLPNASANRDEEQYPDALAVDFRRESIRHLGFAAGPHRCAGSHLARAEMRIALEEWHRRIPEYRVPEGAQLRHRGGADIGLEALPLELTARRPGVAAAAPVPSGVA